MALTRALGFVTSGGRGSKAVPKSCIESAEYIIQCYHAQKILPWAAGQSRAPHVYAEFGNKTFNISDTQDFHNSAAGITDYDFGDSLPAEGQGIICLNKTGADLTSDGGYNMHLGAVVATGDGAVLISNMMEAAHVAVSSGTIQVMEIAKAEDFLEQLGDGDTYAIGLLRT